MCCLCPQLLSNPGSCVGKSLKRPRTTCRFSLCTKRRIGAVDPTVLMETCVSLNSFIEVCLLVTRELYYEGSLFIKVNKMLLS